MPGKKWGRFIINSTLGQTLKPCQRCLIKRLNQPANNVYMHNFFRLFIIDVILFEFEYNLENFKNILRFIIKD